MVWNSTVFEKVDNFRLFYINFVRTKLEYASSLVSEESPVRVYEICYLFY